MCSSFVGTKLAAVVPAQGVRHAHICERIRGCCPEAKQSSAAAFPPPLVGEGQGEGYNSAASDSRLRSDKSHQIQSALVFEFRTSIPLCASSPPLSLSLPHKGGGNRGARTFEIYAMCLRLEPTR